MGSADGSGQSAALPPINYLDIEKIKKDEAADLHGKQAAPAVASPSMPHSHSSDPSPRPPLAIPSLAAGSLNGLVSPPDSRRTSGDEKEQHRPSRQSLPSIHEALGGDQPFPYPPVTTASKMVTSPYLHSHAPTSSPDSSRRSFAEISQRDTSQQSTRSPYMSHQPTSAPTPSPISNSQMDTQDRGGFATAHNPKLPTLHPLQTGHSTASEQSRHHPAPPYTQQQSQHSSPSYEQAPRSATSMNPPFGYNSYPSQPPFSTTPTGPPSSYGAPSSYPPSATARFQSNWRSDGPDGGRPDDSKRIRLTGSTYGESVKRHLETFDVEASLNEIKERATSMLVFAQRYSRPSHQSPGNRLSSVSLPGLAEVDDFSQSARHVQESFVRIRDVVVAQQTSIAAEQAQEHRFKATNRFEADEMRQRQQQIQQNSSYIDEQKQGSFGPSDPKKRRARAAPPGRCHSCKRSETPEWRRGPDGARTLCNACGLHYAKLTKKMGTNKAIGSSNLRPKNLGSTTTAL